MPAAAPAPLATLSSAFLADWIATLRTQCPPAALARFLAGAGLEAGALDDPRARVGHDQITALYQQVALGTGDEMMGLWSRPVRAGALKHICTVVLEASSLGAALHRFASFWNLLLDDWRLELSQSGDEMRLALVARTPGEAPHRFGHMLMLKLAHGLASWLAGRELALREVAFAFPRPGFAEDYPVLFPAPIVFGRDVSSIAFDRAAGALPIMRGRADMPAFLASAPRDWIFTGYSEHALALRLREMIAGSEGLSLRLGEAAAALHVTPRTLMRRLEGEGTSFQGIKDGLRRDLALRDLGRGEKPTEAIAQDLGFASAATFHRAFRRWTGTTPGAQRRARRGGGAGDV